MKTNTAGINLIKKYEGCVLTAYRCPAGVLTIGYGHTGTDVKEDMIITKAQAEKLLKADLIAFEKKVSAYDPIYHFNANQFSALVSFAYNMSFLFVVEKDRWEDLDSDYPKRHIEKISSVLEVSIVTFPAYEDTEVTARAKEALENAKGALENAKARSADADNAELELEKLKAKYLYGGN